MAHFFVRVELHKATDKSYDKLHEFMEGAGYSRFTSAGRKYPDASYTSGELNTEMTAEQLKEIMSRAVIGVLKTEASILVVKYQHESDLAVFGLEKVKRVDTPKK